MAETGVTADSVTLAAPNARSGNNQFSGHNTTVGLSVYFAALNDKGGVAGRKVKLLDCDDQYDPEKAVACFKQVTEGGAFALVGLVGSSPLSKYIPLAMEKKVPLVGAYSGPQFVTDPPKRYVITVRPGYREEEHQLVDHLWEAGIRKIGIIYQNDAYGADHLEGLREALKGKGADLTGSASYERNTNDISAAMETVMKAAPEAVSLAANNTQCAAIIKLAKEKGWSPLFFINSGANVDGFIPQVGKAGDGVLVSETVPSPSRADLPLVAQYQKDLKKYASTEKPCFTSLRGYLDAMVVAEGLKRAGKELTREKFLDALEGIHGWDVGLGKEMEISYSPTDHVGSHRFVFGILRDGDLEPVKDWKKLRK